MAAISAFGGGLDVEGLVAQFRSIEDTRRSPLEIRLETLESRKGALDELDSKLSTLYTISDSFADTVLSDPFASRLGVSSDESVVSITADSTSQVGTHNIEILRLASSDIRVSDLHVETASDFTHITTDQSFVINVAHPTDDDESNRVAVTVVIIAASFAKTNEDLFTDIARAVNDAVAFEIAAGNLDTTERASATAVEESAGDARLVFRSGGTGSAAILEFTDTDGLLETLGLLRTGAPNASTGNGGVITAADELDSEFVLDGLTFNRSGNTVDDALTGVTIVLENLSEAPETITIQSNIEAVRKEVDEFIEAYNEALTFVRAETGASGDFRGDSTYTSISQQLRSIVISQVTGSSSPAYDRINEIGLQTRRDGQLYFEDASKFEAALNANPTLVSDIFNASDGIATRIRDYVFTFTRTSGVITSSQRSITTSITSQNTRLDSFDERLERKVAAFKSQLVRLQSALSQVQAQAAFFQSFSR